MRNDRRVRHLSGQICPESAHFTQGLAYMEVYCFHCKQMLPIANFSRASQRRIYRGKIAHSRCMKCGKNVRKGALAKVEKRLEHPNLSKKNRMKAEKKREKLFYQLVVKPKVHSAKRRACELQARPPWAQASWYVPIYEECARKTMETGIVHHVDHIVPLQGRLVSGLDVPWNLQVLTQAENCSKSNKFNVPGLENMKFKREPTRERIQEDLLSLR